MTKNGFFALIREAYHLTDEEKEMIWKNLKAYIEGSGPNQMSTLELVIQLSKLVGGVIIITLLVLIYLK